MLFLSFSFLSWPPISSRQCVCPKSGPFRHGLAVVAAALVASVQVDEIGMAAAISVCERGHVWQQPLGWAVLGHMGVVEVVGQQQWLIQDIGDIQRHTCMIQSIFAGTNPIYKQHFWIPSRHWQRRCHELQGERQCFPLNFGYSQCLRWLRCTPLIFHEKPMVFLTTRQHFLLPRRADPWRC